MDPQRSNLQNENKGKEEKEERTVTKKTKERKEV